KGLRTLASSSKLEELSLTETDVTDAGLSALRKARPGIDATPAQAITPIFLYAAKRDLEGVRRVLDRAPQALWQRKEWGNLPLHSAASQGSTDVAALLLGRGASIEATNYNGETALQIATKSGRSNLPMMRLLLAAGANPNVEVPDPGSAQALLSEMRTLRQKPVALVPMTNAVCSRTAYTLSGLQNWTTQPLGRLVGPLSGNRSPSGRDFLGLFGQQSVTLKLTGLPTHGNVSIDLQLFLIGSWDGNGGTGNGPDLIDIAVPGVGTLLHSTFFNNTEGTDAGLPMQSFPDPYPFGFHVAYNGAAETRSLGFKETWTQRAYERNGVYKLRFTFAHQGPDFELVLSGLTIAQASVQTLDRDETWGIGGLVVKTD
ncbi:hypothetical protein EON81_17945, partial [bacterium]